MKKSVLLFLLSAVFYSQKCLSQPFGANGAVWHYSASSLIPPLIMTPVVINGSPTTYLFNGEICRTITITSSTCAVADTFITYESNDSVFYYVSNTNHFSLLYNFNAQAGDTIIVYDNLPWGGEDSAIIKVDSVSTMIINGFTKKVFYTLQIPIGSLNILFGGTIIEDIGSTGFLFPQYGFCDPPAGGFRCYEDSIIGLYQVYPNLSCDTVIYLTAGEITTDSQIKISPNPSSSVLNIAFPKANSFVNSTITIRNILGNSIYQVASIKNRQQISIDASKIENGFYLIEIENGKQSWVRKIIINHM